MEKGFVKKVVVDQEENFIPIEKWATARTLFSLEVYNGWKFYQMDVKTHFLNGELKENVFMVQLEGFVVKGKDKKTM